MEARDTSDRRDLIEGQLVGEMAFDKPQRLLGRIHGGLALIRSAAIMTALRMLHLIVLAFDAAEFGQERSALFRLAAARRR
jgi:hypothetical protein